MKYNLRKIMLKAWKTFRKTKGISFAEALHRAWLSAKAEEIKTDPAEQSGRRHCRRGKHLGGLETERLRSAARYKSAVQLLPHLGKQGRRSHI